MYATKKLLAKHNQMKYIKRAMRYAYICLGSNAINAEEMLNRAKEEIDVISPVVCSSSIYLTEPLGYKNQPWFHNQVLKAGHDEQINYRN